VTLETAVNGGKSLEGTGATVWYGMVCYTVVEFNVPLDTV